MKRQLTAAAVKDYTDAPPSIQKAFDKQVKLLLENFPWRTGPRYTRSVRRISPGWAAIVIGFRRVILSSSVSHRD